jgi:stage II sporulation protein E
MGSGPEAGLESGVTVDLVEKFIESGFGETTALNLVNSIMAMKFNEDEKFTTLDMNSIDLYTGDVSFLKVGGVVSFVKSGKNVDVVNESSLPFGILESIDVKPVKRKLKHGDIIVTISDGILDVDKNNLGNYSWLSDFLQNNISNPEVLSREILDMAKRISGGRVFDDMTVVVSKVYAVY